MFLTQVTSIIQREQSTINMEFLKSADVSTSTKKMSFDSSSASSSQTSTKREVEEDNKVGRAQKVRKCSDYSDSHDQRSMVPTSVLKQRAREERHHKMVAEKMRKKGLELLDNMFQGMHLGT